MMKKPMENYYAEQKAEELENLKLPLTTNVPSNLNNPDNTQDNNPEEGSAR